MKDLDSDFMANGLGDGFAVDDLRLQRHDSHHNSLPLHNEVRVKTKTLATSKLHKLFIYHKQLFIKKGVKLSKLPDGRQKINNNYQKN